MRTFFFSAALALTLKAERAERLETVGYVRKEGEMDREEERAVEWEKEGRERRGIDEREGGENLEGGEERRREDEEARVAIDCQILVVWEPAVFFVVDIGNGLFNGFNLPLPDSYFPGNL